MSKTVMISSTLRDLPAHRDVLKDACIRQNMMPLMMETQYADEHNAIHASLEMVDQADIYLGLFAHRYGYRPKNETYREVYLERYGREPKEQDISITEMEYHRAGEREIPRLIFLIDRQHKFTMDDLERGEGEAKLQKLKKRIEGEHTVEFFKSPENLHALAINSLSRHRESAQRAADNVRVIPRPPEPYIAHHYALLKTRTVIGRRIELDYLTDWGANPASDVYKEVRILNIVAMGGMGKSALTWKWFNEIAPREIKPLAGRMWWSFYERDASFENFIIHALAYVSTWPREQVEKIPRPDRMSMLLKILSSEPFLLVLDGWERNMRVYTGFDILSHPTDELDGQTDNRVAGAGKHPMSAARRGASGLHPERRTVDSDAGYFLRLLASVNPTRVLVSSRLYPAELLRGSEYVYGSSAYDLDGLADDDAIALWCDFGGKDSRETLLPLFNDFKNHPLLIQALASEVANYHGARGDFNLWRQDHPDFDPSGLPLEQKRTHVLEFALRGVGEAAGKILRTVAAFRTPAPYNSLIGLLVGEGKPFADKSSLSAALTELEDRGLLGWNKINNRSEMHPIVSGVVWGELNNEARRGIYETIHKYFESCPSDKEQLKSLEGLTDSIESYNALIGLERYDEAVTEFYKDLDQQTLYRWSAPRLRASLLRLLFPDRQPEREPELSDPMDQAYVINGLAGAYVSLGELKLAESMFLRHNAIVEKLLRNDDGDDELDQDDVIYLKENLSIGLSNLSHALRQSGDLRDAETAARRALLIAREVQSQFLEALSLGWWGIALAVRGEDGSAEAVLQRVLQIFRWLRLKKPDDYRKHRWASPESIANALLTRLMLWQKKTDAALNSAAHAWELANIWKNERDLIITQRLQGVVAMEMNDYKKADEYIGQALARAGKVEVVVEEVLALAELAESKRRQGDLERARDLLDHVWTLAERGPYPLFHADALNVLAQIEWHEGNRDKAVEAATAAYRKAWCNGPPFAYHRGLENARKHLAELGAKEPEM